MRCVKSAIARGWNARIRNPHDAWDKLLPTVYVKKNAENSTYDCLNYRVAYGCTALITLKIETDVAGTQGMVESALTAPATPQSYACSYLYGGGSMNFV